MKPLPPLSPDHQPDPKIISNPKRLLLVRSRLMAILMAILSGILIGLLFWLVESSLEVYIFHQGDLVKQLISPDPHELWMRVVVLVSFIFFNLFTQMMILRINLSKKEVMLLNTELEQIFNTAADGMWIIDRNFKVLRVNDTLLGMIGRQRDEIVGKNCHEVFGGGGLCQTPACPLLKILTGEKRLEFDVEKESLDGRKIPCLVTVTPFKGADGQVLGIVEDFKDLTERKKAESKLEEYHLHLEDLVKKRTEELTIANTELQKHIEERKKAELLLGESEERFRLAAKSASDIIYEWNLVNDQVEWFDGIDNLLGYAMGEFPRTSQGREEIIHPDDRQRVLAAINRHLETQEIFFQEYRVQRKNGLILNWVDRGVALRDEEDRPYKWIGVISDVTNQRRMEEALRESEIHYRRLFEDARDAVLLFDLETGLITDANKQAEKLLRRPKKKIIGMHQSQLHPPGQDKYYLDLLKKYTTGLIAQPITVTIFTSEGQRVPVEVSSGLIELAEGKKMQQAIFRDISDRKKAEADLRESEERFRSAFNSAAIGIALIGLDGRFIEPNQALAHIFGYTEEELTAKFFQDLIHPDSLEGDQNLLNQLIAGNLREVNIERQVMHHKGYYFWVQVNAALLHDALGKPLYFITQIQDISRRKQAEKELNNLMKIKSEFTSMVSHELRTPLTAIKEGISIVQEELVGTVNDQQKKVLDTAKKNVDRLARLINEVLDFQKLEIGKINWNLKENDLAEVIHEVYETMLPEIKEKKLDFFLSLEENMPRIRFDKDKIIQVLVNLISNAKKFTEHGEIKIKAQKEAEQIHVMVQDTGEGIRPEDMPKLFQSFQQLGGSSERKVGGTGLGLAISQKIVAQHGGIIWAESEFGHGTIFHFTLPIKVRQG